jgi:hypothetical protein
VKAEYRYFMSESSAAFCLSVLAADILALMPRLAHNADMLDMTPPTLETERMEPTSESRLLERWVLPRNDT